MTEWENAIGIEVCQICHIRMNINVYMFVMVGGFECDVILMECSGI